MNKKGYCYNLGTVRANDLYLKFLGNSMVFQESPPCVEVNK